MLLLLLLQLTLLLPLLHCAVDNKHERYDKQKKKRPKDTTTSTTGSKNKNTQQEKYEKKEKITADEIIIEAIKKGDLLPQDDNETIDDCQSNWGAANEMK